MPIRFLALIFLAVAAGAALVQAQNAVRPAPGRPACVGGHTDHLLPIVYGRPTPQTVRQARQGRVVLRGCLVSGRDPRYYCPIHKKDL